ncbi:MAG TPA: hypothetical protein VIV57_27305 [Anaeromyxobacter sp.]
MGKKLVKLFEFIEDEKGNHGEGGGGQANQDHPGIGPGHPRPPENVEALTRAAVQGTGKKPPAE